MQKKETRFVFSWTDCLISLDILCAAAGLSFLLRIFEGAEECTPMLFILAIFLISRYTAGYLFGTVCSLISVFLVNYVFTYPYFAFNFTITGYPLTFLCMLLISIMTSTLTTQTKQQEKVRSEVAQEKMRANLLRGIRACKVSPAP